MIATFEERRTTVQALQLTPDTLQEMLTWTGGQQVGTSVWFADRHRGHIAYQGDWVVQANGGGGGFHILSEDAFHDRYQAVRS